MHRFIRSNLRLNLIARNVSGWARISKSSISGSRQSEPTQNLQYISLMHGLFLQNLRCYWSEESGSNVGLDVFRVSRLETYTPWTVSRILGRNPCPALCTDRWLTGNKQEIPAYHSSLFRLPINLSHLIHYWPAVATCAYHKVSNASMSYIRFRVTSIIKLQQYTIKWNLLAR